MATKVKKWFIQSWGTYPNDTLVCVAMNHKEILDLMRRKNMDFDTAVAWQKEKDELEENFSDLGFVWAYGPRTILCFREWKNDWHNIGVLVHELHHLVSHVLGKERGMIEEKEALAYQQEYLFHEMLHKLNKKK